MMQSYGDFNKTGLTFSISDVNFDSNSLDLVPILLNNPENETINCSNEQINDLILDFPATRNITSVDNHSNISYTHYQSNTNQEINRPNIFISDGFVNSNNTIIGNETSSQKSFSNIIPESFATNSQINPPSVFRENISDTFNSQYEEVSNYWFYCVIINGLAEWKPFSIKDSNRIEIKFCENIRNSENKYTSMDDCVATDGGRYDVFINKRQKVSVYWVEAPMEIRRASWFYRPEDESFYLPYSEMECEKLEEKFKYVLENNLWHQPFELNSNSRERCLEDRFVFHSPHTMVEYRRYGYLSGSDNVMKGRVVFRGVEGFKNHLELGESDNIDHVIFVIHGIGSVCDMAGRGIVECVQAMKNISTKMLKSHFPQHNGRIELLPVSWHSKFHLETSSVDRDLSKITLKSVPKLRNFTNNTLVDVLCYSSPTYCQTILTIVAAEMNRLRHLFVSRNPQYDGSISIAGHSLGSMIAFDLTSLQGNNFVNNLVPILDIDAVPCLEFEVGHLFALGSPISLLLTARGHSFLGEEFHLSHCKGFFNIFHPFDPVAYRMEPMLVPHCQTRPVVIPHHKGRKRLHLELKDNLVRVSQDIKTKLFQTLKSTWSSLQEFATAHTGNLADELGDENEMVRVLNKIDNNIGERDDVESTTAEVEVLMGQLNDGKRVDYVLQEAPLESFNDYLFALGSHACYWDSEDTILMMLKEIYLTLNVSPETRPMESSINITKPPAHLMNYISNETQLPPIIPLVSPHQTMTNTVLPPTFPNVQSKPFFIPNFSVDESNKDQINFNVSGNRKSEPPADITNEKQNQFMVYSLKPTVDLSQPTSLISHESSKIIEESSFNYDLKTLEKPNISKYDQTDKNIITDNFIELQSTSIDQISKECPHLSEMDESYTSIIQYSTNELHPSHVSEIDTKLPFNSCQINKNFSLNSLQKLNSSESITQTQTQANFETSHENKNQKEKILSYPPPPMMPNESTDVYHPITSHGYVSPINNYPLMLSNNRIHQRQSSAMNLHNPPLVIPNKSINMFYPSLSTENTDCQSNSDSSQSSDQFNIKMNSSITNLQPPPTMLQNTFQPARVSSESDFSTNSQALDSIKYCQSSQPLQSNSLNQFQSTITNPHISDSPLHCSPFPMILHNKSLNQFQSATEFSTNFSNYPQSLPANSDVSSSRTEFPTNYSTTNQSKTSQIMDFQPPTMLQNQLVNVFNPNQSSDIHVSSINDNYFESATFDDNQFQTNISSSQVNFDDLSLKSEIPIEMQQSSNYSFNNLISSNQNSPLFETTLKSSNVSNFDSLFNSESPNSSSAMLGTSKYSVLSYQVDSNPCLFDSKPKLKSNQVPIQDVPSNYCRTPSPRISSQNVRNSPKVLSGTSSVFNSKPLIPQSGKLFKKK